MSKYFNVEDFENQDPPDHSYELLAHFFIATMGEEYPHLLEKAYHVLEWMLHKEYRANNPTLGLEKLRVLLVK